MHLSTSQLNHNEHEDLSDTPKRNVTSERES